MLRELSRAESCGEMESWAEEVRERDAQRRNGMKSEMKEFTSSLGQRRNLGVEVVAWIE